MKPCLTDPARRQAVRLQAFTLIELMLAVAISTIIVGSLYAVFNQTQRAMRAGNNQTDVLESGRAAMELITREITQMSATRVAGYTNFVVGLVPTNLAGAAALNRYYANTTAKDLSNYQPVLQALPPSPRRRTNTLDEVFWFSKVGIVGSGTALRVIDVQNGVGTLARLSLSLTNPLPWALDFYPAVAGAPAANYARIADGVIHFRIQAYDSRGFPMAWPYVYPAVATNSYGTNVFLQPDQLATETRATFVGTALPAYLEIELGVLEPTIVERAKSMPSTASNNAGRKFLSNHAGQVHVFRQRVPIQEGAIYPSFLPQ